MATISRRKDIIDLIITKLKTINGDVSADDATYTYITNIGDRVFRGFKTLEAINDFPSLYVTPGVETYLYNTVGNTQAGLDIKVRGFVKVEADRDALDDLTDDIDHLVYSMKTDIHSIQLLQVASVDTDNGLLEDYGILEMIIQIIYEVSTI